jgi:hypothetical protein
VVTARREKKTRLTLFAYLSVGGFAHKTIVLTILPPPTVISAIRPIMKINTKKCSPIKKGAPEEAMLHPNKYIPPVTPSSSNLGRKQKYLATISFTPVLTSKRTPDRRLVDEAEIDKLNQQLDEIFLGSKEEEEEKKEDDKPKEDRNASNNKLSGRIYKTVHSYKTSKSSQVLRSARLVELAS